jgi:hypothetical protein
MRPSLPVDRYLERLLEHLDEWQQEVGREAVQGRALERVRTRDIAIEDEATRRRHLSSQQAERQR